MHGDASNIPCVSHKGVFMTASDDTTNQPVKRCPTCSEEKPLTTEYYNRNRARSDGFDSHCKVCRSAMGKERAKKPEFQEWRKAYMQEYQSRPGYVEKRREYDREYKRKARLIPEQREHMNSVYRKWSSRPDVRQKQRDYDKTPDRKARHRQIESKRRTRPDVQHKMKVYWVTKGRILNRYYQAQRRARKLELPNTLTTAEWQRCLDYFNHRCVACGSANGLWTVIVADHWIPLASLDCPGTIAMNIVPLCHSKKGGIGGCNNSKIDRNPQEWTINTFDKRKSADVMKRVADYFEWVKSCE